MNEVPKRSWFRLPANTNPKATPSGVVRWAVFGAVASGLFWGVQEFRDANYIPLWALPFWVALGGFVGGLIEWQLDDTDDEPPPPATYS